MPKIPFNYVQVSEGLICLHQDRTPFTGPPMYRNREVCYGSASVFWPALLLPQLPMRHVPMLMFWALDTQVKFLFVLSETAVKFSWSINKMYVTDRDNR